MGNERTKRDDRQEGVFYFAVIAKPGASHRRGDREVRSGKFRADFPGPNPCAGARASHAVRWVRPLHSIVATFGARVRRRRKWSPVVFGGIELRRQHGRASLPGAGSRSRCGGSPITPPGWPRPE